MKTEVKEAGKIEAPAYWARDTFTTLRSEGFWEVFSYENQLIVEEAAIVDKLLVTSPH